MPVVNRPRRNQPAREEVRLRRVVPVVPDLGTTEWTELMEDLTKMGCLGLLERPWGFKEERIIRELLNKVDNQFDGSIRARPDLWTEQTWREVYSFTPGGAKGLGRKDEYCHNRFHGEINARDGYAVKDCKDARELRLLEFLAPILRPEKPSRLTITIGNQIFGALTGGQKMDWGEIFADMISGLIPKVRSSRPTPLCPYLFHLYEHHGVLTMNEEAIWKNQDAVRRFGESEGEEEPEEEGTDSECEEGKAGDRKRMKVTPVEGRGTPPTPTKPITPQGGPSAGPSGIPMMEKMGPETQPWGRTGEQAEGSRRGKAAVEEYPDNMDERDPFTMLVRTVSEIRADWQIKATAMGKIAALVGGLPDRSLPVKVAECITNPDEIRKTEIEIARLKEDVEHLKMEISMYKNDMVSTRELADDVQRTAERVTNILGQSGEAVMKARLFDEKVHEDAKLSGTRIVRILNEYAEQLTQTVTDMREAADRIQECSRKLSGSLTRLSDLSFPNTFSSPANLRMGSEHTPQSKKSGRRRNLVHIESSDEVIEIHPVRTEVEEVQPMQAGPAGPDPDSASRVRNLGDLFEGLDPEAAEQAIDEAVPMEVGHPM
jgi:hypothetical protein